MNNYYIHLFKTDYGPYLYDVFTNNLIPISYNIYNNLLNNTVQYDNDTQQFILESKKKGMFGEWPKEIKFYISDKQLSYMINNTLSNISLSITENCNLKCKYCVYDWKHNDNYKPHVMNEKIAFKAIDLLIESSKYSPELHLGFYGGEPLLNFDLIKNCVKYIKQKTRGQILRFYITTNATLLTNEIQDFFIDNKFMLTISLDGPQYIHDRYRIFKNGDATYDIIIRNLKSLRDKNLLYFKNNVILNTVLAPPIFAEKMEYYILGSNIKIQLSNMTKGEKVLNDLNDIEKFEKENIYRLLWNDFRYNYQTYKKTKNYFIKDLYNIYSMKFNNSQVCYPSGACIPCVSRLFVNFDGKLLPCERVNESNSNYIIGNVESGINLNKVKNLINWYMKILENRCTHCWANKLCPQCFRNADNPSKKRNADCELTKSSVENTLINYVNIISENTDIVTEFINNDH